jgi:hypothetical protein
VAATQIGDSNLKVVFRVPPCYKGNDPVVLPYDGRKRESGEIPELPRSGKWERTPHRALTANAVGKPRQVGSSNAHKSEDLPDHSRMA